MIVRVATLRCVAAIAFMVLLFAACDDDDSGGNVAGPSEPRPQVTFIGSDNCGLCHSQIFNEFRKSGHPYKLNKVVNGQPPSYPFSTVPNPPTGVSWNDVAYVIGGFGWKARFIGQDGFIITAGGNNQLNLATGEFVDYHKDELKPYDCGRCHTTGYQATGNQDGLPGLVGTWAFPGIQCEECHGRGSLHALSPETVQLTIDTRPEACGSCHNRGGLNDIIPASGGFIRHHEQYNEMVAGGHKFLSCVTCHDPHTGVVYNDLEDAQAIRTQCEDCHSDARQSLRDAPLAGVKADFDCESCHMPFAAKSAVKFDTYVGDIRSHLVEINADVLAEPFNGGNASHFLTLEFTCLGCHTDDTKEWAAGEALNVHGDYGANRSLGLAQ